MPSRAPSAIAGALSSHASPLASSQVTSPGMQSSIATGCEAVQPYETPRAAPEHTLTQQGANVARPINSAKATGASLYAKQVGELSSTCAAQPYVHTSIAFWMAT